MNITTIPKEITRGEELVVIPRRLYERFLRAVKAKEKFHLNSSLDQELKEALEDVKMGRIIGPFSSLSKGLKALKVSK